MEDLKKIKTGHINGDLDITYLDLDITRDSKYLDYGVNLFDNSFTNSFYNKLDSIW